MVAVIFRGEGGSLGFADAETMKPFHADEASKIPRRPPARTNPRACSFGKSGPPSAEPSLDDFPTRRSNAAAPTQPASEWESFVNFRDVREKRGQ